MLRINLEGNGVKDGWYLAKFINYELRGSKEIQGECFPVGNLCFELENGQVVKQFTYLVGWNNFLPKKLIVAVKGNVESCDLDTLKYSEVVIKIENKIESSNTYTNVTDIVSKEEGLKKIKEQSSKTKVLDALHSNENSIDDFTIDF